MEYIELPNNQIIIKMQGSMEVKKNLVRNDIIGTFNLPFNIISTTMFGYLDNVSETDAQVMTVLNVQNGKTLIPESVKLVVL